MVAEALALQKGLHLALQSEYKNIEIEGDNLLVINTIKGIWNSPWKISTIIHDIILMLTFFDNRKLRHIYREANTAAEWIANVSHLHSRP